MNITKKGQVTIPSAIREKYHFLPETEVDFKEENGRVYLVKSEPSLVAEGPFDYAMGKATSGLSTEEIMNLTRGDIS